MTLDGFIKKAKEVHGDKYDYSKVEYKNSKTKVCIICPIHGEFFQTPYNHLKGFGCSKCGHEKTSSAKTSNTSTFIEKAMSVHNDKYDYSKTNYINTKTKVCIICPEHGEFWQTPSTHLSGGGCWKCGLQRISNVRKYTTEKFIEKAKKIHGDKYDYSKVDYVDSKTKVCIICPKHGEFWQTPNNHINGLGCAECGHEYKSLFEEDVFSKLKELNIRMIRQKTFDWLKYRTNMFLDFYLPDYNIAIEVQGEQHYKPSDFFGGEETFVNQQKRDKKKFDLCKKHNIKIFYLRNRNKYNLNEIMQYINETTIKEAKNST